MVKFGQNRTNVQIKGGGGQRAFEQCSKKLHFSCRMASLCGDVITSFLLPIVIILFISCRHKQKSFLFAVLLHGHIEIFSHAENHL